ncbi:ribose-phosphate diphosphokinase [Candidatus Methylacidiphilum fumarolicum]|uniref:Ribose-phosphate pyrophosphokinase n=2 Tax=Candidatus Methylacidiphilum fumarolicum TaxID=591154 RepID=I0K0F9_METFB|nr:ribose-phosphate pyrophosphokinase [Candidatus Methylacidiphilum fumarolicum]MBW6414563.1 ribose-phosphate pyrophosphokinase [Candidatus Methylacidiphilum fumarolicum]TFE65569.1 ribose-phosphate pyrophosphokinase [Candidatus Methylacidiphilum fumarolicum]TFE73672.1 ribose-phosphate diphosphokinase [Candidatus Methylacidiphilum fumarolicum]TFE75398.1 ribose-phosphate diphosphokinase [Candidatus Methylacidiphilum fumarolicum]TFE77428.1 ribose-phosphate pyrophosphokinase [Candidatus Methylacid
MNDEYKLLKIFSGRANPALATKIAQYVGIPLGQATISSFPDGETFVKFNENIRGRDVFIVQPTCPPTNHNLMELLIMIDAARRASAARVTAVIPFYGYARQDRKDQPRVSITAKLVANLLVAAGANRVLAMDLHAQQIQGFFDIPVDHLTAVPVFYKFLEANNLLDLVVVSPDVGGIKMASTYSQLLGKGLALVVKKRVDAYHTEADFVVGDVEGRDVLIVDDLTETAGTVVSAATILKKMGARRIYAGISHAVLNQIGIGRLRSSHLEELITTNSVPVPVVEGVRVTVLDVAPLLGEAIKRIHTGMSVTSLFEVDGKKINL